MAEQPQTGGQDTVVTGVLAGALILSIPVGAILIVLAVLLDRPVIGIIGFAAMLPMVVLVSTAMLAAAVAQVRGTKAARARADACGPALVIAQAHRVHGERRADPGWLALQADAIGFYPLYSTEDVRIGHTGAMRTVVEDINHPGRELLRIRWTIGDREAQADFWVTDPASWLGLDPQPLTKAAPIVEGD